MPMFSIIVPVYNIEKYLDKCIKSILEQSYTDYELILVDDGSPDRCGEIIDAYAKADKRIKAIHKKNEGLTLARNSGLAAAKGEYIVNVDGDDCLVPGALQCLYEHIADTHADVYFFGFYTQSSEKTDMEMPDFEAGMYSGYEKKRRLYERMVYDSKKRFFSFGIYPSVWSRIVKRGLFSEVRFKINPYLDIGEDLATTLLIMLKAETIFFIPEPLYLYRIREGSAIHTFNINEMKFAADMLKDLSASPYISEDRYAMKHQLGAYTADVLYNHLCAYAKRADSYKQYIEHIQNMDDVIFEFIGHCRYEINSLREMIIITMMRKKLWYMPWLYARSYRNEKRR